MNIALRECPTCEKQTIQVRRKEHYNGEAKYRTFEIWYCPHCAKYNRDGGIEKLIEAVDKVGRIT